MQRQMLRYAAVMIAGLAAFSAPAVGQRSSLAMLDQIDTGKWELRLRESGRSSEQLCVSNGRRLIQLRHPAGNCDRVVVEDGPSEVTVQYTCRGRGYGRTQIRRETNRLVQIQSQGIVDGLPFDFSAEGRRVGECASS